MYPVTGSVGSVNPIPVRTDKTRAMYETSHVDIFENFDTTTVTKSYARTFTASNSVLYAETAGKTIELNNVWAIHVEVYAV